MTQGQLRVAMVGLRHGHAGSVDPQKPSPGYIQTFKQLDGVALVAYCEDTDRRRLDLARAFDPAAHCYDSVDDLIAHEDFDLACICLPANEVPAAGIKLAEAGKHFFMEKQFARTASDLAPLVTAVKRSGVKVLPGYPWRFHPVAQDLRRLIDKGMLGKPLSIESRQVVSQVRPGERDPTGIFYRNDTEGGGVLHMIGGHYLDLMGFVAGCKAKAVQAMVGRPVGHIEAPLEDVALLTIEYENGAFGSLHAGYLLPEQSDGHDACLIFRGESGWANWASTRTPRLVVKSTAPQWAGAPVRTLEYTIAPFAGYGRAQWLTEIMQRFILNIKVGQEPALTVDDALHVLQLIEAAYESARTGRRVEVRYGVEAAASGQT